eukprot:161890_1
MMSSTPECLGLPESVRYDIDSLDKFDLEDQITGSYDSLVDQNMKLQHDNHEYRTLVSELQSKLAHFELQCDSQQQNICALQQQLAIQASVYDKKLNDFLACANDYDVKRTQQLSCVTKQYYNLRSDYTKLQHKYIAHTGGDYKSWKWCHIYQWIVHTVNDDRLSKYQNILYTNLKEQDITGATLPSLNDDDLYYLGIKDHNDRQLFTNYISKLVRGTQYHAVPPSPTSSVTVTVPSTSSQSTEHSHKSLTPHQLKQIRIRQQNIVYVVGLPVSLCNAKLLKSEEWFGKYGVISRICFNTSPKCVKANSIPTFVTYTNEQDAELAIQKMNLFCLSDGTRLKTNYGRTKYCPSFCAGVPCSNGKCKFLHQFAKYDDIITEQEISDFNAIRAGPPSRFNRK